MEPADECYSVTLLESVKYYHSARRGVPPCGSTTTLARCQAAEGLGGTVPRAPVSSAAREAPARLLVEPKLLETRVRKGPPVDRVLAPEGHPL